VKLRGVEQWVVRLGANIRAARRAQGLTQEELALAIGTSISHIGRIERGERPPSMRTLVRLAVALHTVPEKLVEGICQPDDE
jgi:transcriptional regulator with XRE-family HTH domain